MLFQQCARNACILAFLSIALPDTLRSQDSARPDSSVSVRSLADLRASVRLHPEVRMAEAEAEAARRMISMRSTWMDPMITLGVDNLPTGSFAFDQDMMTSKSIGIGQQIPFPGKLSAGRAAAEQRVTVAELKIAEKQNELRRDVTVAYYDLYPLRKRIEAYQEHLEDLNEIGAIVKTRFENGGASQQDMIRIELRRSEIERQILRERSMLAMRLAELKRLVDQPSEIITPEVLGLPEVDLSVQQLDSIALNERPYLQAIRAESRRYQLEFERTRLERYPDFNVMLMYMQRDELAPGALMNPIVEDNSGGHGATSSTAAVPLDDMLSLTVSFPLPLGLGGKQSDAEGELLAMQTMQLAEHESMAQMIRAMIQGKLAELRSLREQYELMTTVTLPTLQLSLETAVVNYQNFNTDIVSILSAELDLLHRAEESFQLAADYHKALAELEYLTGAELWRM